MDCSHPDQWKMSGGVERAKCNLLAHLRACSRIYLRCYKINNTNWSCTQQMSGLLYDPMYGVYAGSLCVLCVINNIILVFYANLGPITQMLCDVRPLRMFTFKVPHVCFVNVTQNTQYCVFSHTLCSSFCLWHSTAL